MNTLTTNELVESIGRFHEQGYLILRDFIEPGVIQAVRAETGKLADEYIEKLRADGKIKQTFSEEPFETRLVKVYANCAGDPPTTFRTELHRPGFFRLFFHPRLLDVVERLLGPEIRLYPNYSIRPKLPDHEATLVPWHQDAGYTASGRHGHDSKAGNLKADELRMVNVWTPLVPATVENGCMQFIPGTHKLGVVPHAQKNKFYLEIAEEYLQPRLTQAINVELDPGDVVLFSNLLFHRGLPNRSGKIRWSSDWRYQDARQSTLRTEQGHIARSRSSPRSAVRDEQQWAELSFV